MVRHALKIVVIGGGSNQYGVLDHFTDEFAKALKNAGADVTVYQGTPSDLDFQRPDLTLSFFPLEGVIGNKFMWEHLKIPHFYFTVDSIDYIFKLLESDYFVASLRDRDSCLMAEQMGHKNVLFLPHAASKDLTPNYHSERPYELVFLGTNLSFKNEDFLYTSFSKEFHPIIQRTIEIYEQDDYTGYHHAFIKACQEDKSFNSTFFSNLDTPFLFQTLDILIRGRQRLKLIQSIKNIPIHLFGNSMEDSSWEEILEGQKNVILHPGVSFEKALQIMGQAKIVLNTTAATKQASHERILYSYQKGALPLTLQNPYLSETFTDEKNILFYQSGKEEEIEPKILRFLEDKTLRLEAVKSGHQVVLTHHTWDVRARTFLDWQPLKHIKRFKN